MAKQRVVNTYFWSDDFILDLKADEKLLFLYVLTNPQTDLCGAYQIAMQKMVFETKLTERRILTILEKFEQAKKVCYRNGWMIVKNFTRHQSSSSATVAKGIERSLSHCPDWVKELRLIGFDRVSKGVTPEPELLPEPEPTEVCAAGARVNPISEAEEIYTETVMNGLRDRYKLVQLRDEASWLTGLLWAFENSFPPTDFLECFDLLTKQKWRNGRLTGKIVADNLPELEQRRKEIEDQENGIGERKTGAEKSRDNALANERLADEIRSGKHNTAVTRLFGGDGESDFKNTLPS